MFSIWLPEHREKAGREATLARVVTKSHTTHTYYTKHSTDKQRYLTYIKLNFNSKYLFPLRAHLSFEKNLVIT